VLFLGSTCPLAEKDVKSSKRGFTLIETLVAITLLTVALVAPMSLVTQSLTTAYYAREQSIAFNLAQEAIETIRSARDNSILESAFGSEVDYLADILAFNGQPFTVDVRDNSMVECPSGVCPPLESDGSLYGYGIGNPTVFTRSVVAELVSGSSDEVRVTVSVSWTTGSFSTRTVTISENLYRWVGEEISKGGTEEMLSIARDFGFEMRGDTYHDSSVT